jgi:hypothetical protein
MEFESLATSSRRNYVTLGYTHPVQGSQAAREPSVTDNDTCPRRGVRVPNPPLLVRTLRS